MGIGLSFNPLFLNTTFPTHTPPPETRENLGFLMFSGGLIYKIGNDRVNNVSEQVSIRNMVDTKDNRGLFFYPVFFTDTDDSQDSTGREGTIFIPLYHFYPQVNI